MTQEEKRRIGKVIGVVHAVIREEGITYGESVPLLCYLFVEFLEEVERTSGKEAKRGAILQLSRALSRMMDARVFIVEGAPSPGWMSDLTLDIEERKRRILELNSKMKKAMKKGKGESK